MSRPATGFGLIPSVISCFAHLNDPLQACEISTVDINTSGLNEGVVLALEVRVTHISLTKVVAHHMRNKNVK